MFADHLKKWISDTLHVTGDFSVEHPREMDHGDYSTNVALVEAKKLGKNPKELAGEYIELLRKNIFENIEKIEVADPGFINFYLKPEFFSQAIAGALEHKNFWGSNEILGRQKIMVEFTDPNPFKEFHIGHLMSNAIGESISRLLQANGAQVLRVNWQGDVGLHIAKAVWGLKASHQISPFSITSLAQAYARGNEAFENNETDKNEIIEINKILYGERKDTSETEWVKKWYEEGRKTSLEYFEKMYKRIGMESCQNGNAFDHYFFESIEGPKGKKLVEEYLDKGVFEKSDGAVVFKGEQYGLHTRVFINSNGLPTYEAKELGLNQEKFVVEPELSRSIIVTGNEIREYFKVLLKAMSLVLPNVAEKTIHIDHGMMRLPEGKMSSRTGNVITAESLIANVKEKILEKMKDREFSDEKRNDIAEIVAIGALKYSILRQATGKDIIFDFDKSLSFEGDSGPYLQYSYVRAQSILRKVPTLLEGREADPRVGPEWKTTTLEKLIARFGEVVAEAGEEFAPHTVATYLIELAGAFNSFYAVEKIVDASDANSPYKIALTEAFAQTMKNGLHLLGIKVPEEM